MYFVVSDNQVKGLHSHAASWPPEFTVLEATPELLALFYAGCTRYDPVAKTFVTPPFTDLAALRGAMLTEATSILNTWAREKHYSNLADLVSYKDSLDAEMTADALKGIAARDKMRLDILEYTANLPTKFSLTLSEAMGQITKPTW